ncbi:MULTISPECIES: DNA-binding protein [Pseudomonas]|uniref:KfrA N-terminal DNA-binding domain-containing protein n=2 Tax=Pseudomonas TaxID=286 RepID=A0A1L7NNT4_PSEPU|nr:MULTISPECIES: DNA-binding protein [Pseudomonas]HCF2575626.1 DNA-binding protein [Pseudomonas aeruginosa]AGN82315.1 hypothetical protein L483_15325 [Pseudomonas putida H8234]KYC19315.1 hypothetical protein WM94_18505 [Pseudomonas sp. ABFPK]MBA1319507.1 hypothetical protein [Pseudomonas monteilii]MBP2086345.1 DNA repair exonuclease SbcCD ATPase subunit [Pseudomonas sp. PvP089]
MTSTGISSDKRLSTRDLVHVYARKLLDAGREVRQADIRECIYVNHDIKASPNLVYEEIKKFWSEIGPVLSARLRRPGVPDAVCEKLDEVWDVALRAAADSHAVERKALEAEAAAAVVAAKVAQENERTASASLEAQRRELAGLMADKERLTVQLDQVSADVRQLQAELADLNAKLVTSSQSHSEEIKRLQEVHHGAIERTQEMHRGELERLQEQLKAANTATETAQAKAETARVAAEQHLEKTENHLMMETARVRDDERAKTERVSKELQQSLTLVDQLRIQRSKATDEAAEMRGRLEATQQGLRALEAQNKELRELNTTLQTALLEGLRDAKAGSLAADE